MVSQSVMVPMEIGDQFYVLLHEGALKGGGISHTFTSLNGHKIATMALPEHSDHNNDILRIVTFSIHRYQELTQEVAV